MAFHAERARSLLIHLGASLAMVVSAIAAGPRPLSPLAQKPTFSSKTEAMYVTATVIDKDGRLVTGLTRDDFEIREDGAPREITVFGNDTVPFAIVVMLDVSGSMFPNLGLMRRGIQALIGHFEPGDRASIGSFQGLPMIDPRFTANPQRLMESVSGAMGGMGTPCLGQWDPTVIAKRNGLGSAVWAGVQCGLEHVASDAETPRRVVMVVTDAMDNVSRTMDPIDPTGAVERVGITVGPADLEKMADQFGIMIYGVGMIGYDGLDSVALRSLTEKTGGGYFQLNDFAQVVPTFARVADELRHQYVFGFTPALVDEWKRRIDVRARQPGTVTRWRRVFLQQAPVFTNKAGPTPRAETRAADRPATGTGAALKGRDAIIDALDKYERAEWVDIIHDTDPKRTAVRLDEITRAVGEWVPGRGVEHETRRRLAAASYLLEVLEQHARDKASWENGQAGAVTLEWACALLRRGPPLPVELFWHVASMGLLERAGATAALLTHLEHMQARFPGEPRLMLAGAIVEELKSWRYLTDARDLQQRPVTANRILAALERASHADAVRAEALIRLGYSELRLGHVDAALKHFDDAGSPADPFLQYWLHLFRGESLQQAGRLKEAIVSFERALGAVPYAQSAAFELGAALVEDRRSSEAAALMIRVLALQPPVHDPWTSYLAPDMRFWPEVIARLRKTIVVP